MTQTAMPALDYATIVPKPGVITWYKVYCFAMALMYAVLVAAGLWLWSEEPAQSPDAVTWIILTVVSAPLAILYVVGAFTPRSRAGWIFGIVLIAIGMSGCTLVAAVPVLIFWINARTRAWFSA